VTADDGAYRAISERNCMIQSARPLPTRPR
jgi:hypothetical protein